VKSEKLHTFFTSAPGTAVGSTPWPLYCQEAEGVSAGLYTSCPHPINRAWSVAVQLVFVKTEQPQLACHNWTPNIHPVDSHHTNWPIPTHLLHLYYLMTVVINKGNCILSKHNYVLVVYWVFTIIWHNYIFRPLMLAIFRLYITLLFDDTNWMTHLKKGNCILSCKGRKGPQLGD
jgi:hypothetical protein